MRISAFKYNRKSSRGVRGMAKRSLALFSALVMMLSLVTPGLAAEETAVNYTVAGQPVCGLGETDGHVHDETCYAQGELICGLAEHTHGAACYGPGEAVLVCENADEEHEHGDECYVAEEVLICGLAEHTHGESCYAPVVPPAENPDETQEPDDDEETGDGEKAGEGEENAEGGESAESGEPAEGEELETEDGEEETEDIDLLMADEPMPLNIVTEESNKKPDTIYINNLMLGHVDYDGVTIDLATRAYTTAGWSKQNKAGCAPNSDGNRFIVFTGETLDLEIRASGAIDDYGFEVDNAALTKNAEERTENLLTTSFIGVAPGDCTITEKSTGQKFYITVKYPLYVLTNQGLFHKHFLHEYLEAADWGYWDTDMIVSPMTGLPLFIKNLGYGTSWAGDTPRDYIIRVGDTVTLVYPKAMGANYGVTSGNAGQIILEQSDGDALGYPGMYVVKVKPNTGAGGRYTIHCGNEAENEFNSFYIKVDSDKTVQHFDIEVADGAQCTVTEARFKVSKDGTVSEQGSELRRDLDVRVTGVNKCEVFDSGNQHVTGRNFNGVLGSDQYGRITEGAQNEFTSAYKVNPATGEAIVGNMADRDVDYDAIDHVRYSLQISLYDEQDNMVATSRNFSIDLDGEDIRYALNKCPGRNGLDFAIRLDLNAITIELEGIKGIIGRGWDDDLDNGAYSFTLKAADPTKRTDEFYPMPVGSQKNAQGEYEYTVKNDGQNFQFQSMFLEDGIYEYIITENDLGPNAPSNMKKDGGSVKIAITIENGEVAGVAVQRLNENGEVIDGNITFNNEYEEKPQKTETDPGDMLPVLVGQEITYEISWKNYKANTADGTTVIITDTLDPNVEFVSASFGDVTLSGAGTQTGADGHGDIEIKYEGGTVTWTLNGRPGFDVDTRKQLDGSEGVVTLTVKVLESALKAPGDTALGIVRNVAEVQVGDDPAVETNEQKNPVSEPHKRETQVNGEDVTPTDNPDGSFTGPTVVPRNPADTGDTITYEIDWQNYHMDQGNGEDVATVTVTDKLDPGVDFVSASFGGVELQAPNTTATGVDAENENSPVTITYDADAHTVTWTLENRPGIDSDGTKNDGSYGTVELTVRVNEDAIYDWDYSADGTADTNDVNRDTKDHIVHNQAGVQVDNDPKQKTEKIDNPLPEPHKTEPDPGDGKYVSPGDEITYHIEWRNYQEEAATVTITDKLDENVVFVSASYGGVTLNGEGTQNSGEITINYDGTTVTWTLANRPAGEPDAPVVLVVKVAAEAGGSIVKNQASVKVGNDPFFDTEVVRNPVYPYKNEVVPGEGVPRKVGENITYDILWLTLTDAISETVITDKLDDGVDFVSASYDTITLSGEGDTTGTSNTGANDGPLTVKIEYSEETRTVTWTITGEQETGENAQYAVHLTVKVNKNASKDGSITNIATVNGHTTNETWNPVPEEHKKETDPGDDVPVRPGDEIDYEIDWENYHRDDLTTEGIDESRSTVTIVDTLDPNMEFVSASFGGVTLSAGKTSASGKDAHGGITISYNKQNNTVTWVLSNRPGRADDGSRVPDNGSTGTVKVTGKVLPGAVTPGEVVNTATVQVGRDDAIDLEQPRNPVPDIEKTETDPGADQLVQVGQEVTYEVKWQNYFVDAADVTVTDRLDPGVDFVSASFGGVELKAPNATANGEDANNGNSPIAISYDEATHTVTWVLEDRPGETKGSVELVVRVNEDAFYGWEYDDDADGPENVGTNKDYEIHNQARVGVGEDPAMNTNIIDNPVNDPHKTETDPGENLPVLVGEEITYEITWQNYKSDKATVTIVDPLDENVEFVRADNGGVYDEGAHTVTWTLKDRAAKSDGKVTLTVRVLDGAVAVGEVMNTATVQVDNDEIVQLEEPHNPVPDVSKTEPDPGPGELVQPGDVITYNINWENYHRPDEENQDNGYATVTVTDPLDKNVEFVSASFGGVTLDENNGGEGADGDGKIAISYDEKTHTVTWVMENRPGRDENGDRQTGSTGTVELQVRVLESAWNVGRVENQAEVQVGTDPKLKTEIIKNPTTPHKTEVDPGENIPVRPGEEITYEITWQNFTENTTAVTVVDPLDKNVEFVSASFGGVTLRAGKTSASGKDASGTITISYKDGAVTWQLNDRPANGKPGYDGKVTLKVRVLKSAEKAGWVENEATVTVDNTSHQTNKPRNPVPDLHKVETDPGDGKTVTVDQKITYDINWKNYKSETAHVVVFDPLDKGVEFVSASFDGVTLDAGKTSVTGSGFTIRYDKRSHTVTWDLGEQAGEATGKVTLTVKVTADAHKAGAVKNQGFMQIDDDPVQGTEIPKNPVKTDGTPPRTGDDSNPLLWTAVLGVFTAALAVTAGVFRKRKSTR